MSQLPNPVRLTAPQGRPRYVFTQASSLICLLFDVMHRFGPRIPLTEDANRAVQKAIMALSFGETPEPMHHFVWSGLDTIDWTSVRDPGWGASSLSVLRLMHLLAIGMAGLPPIGFDGVDVPEPIPYGRVISMILAAEPGMAVMMKIRNGNRRSIVTTTKAFEAEHGDRFRVEVEPINALPPNELFDLAVPYDFYG